MTSQQEADLKLLCHRLAKQHGTPGSPEYERAYWRLHLFYTDCVAAGDHTPEKFTFTTPTKGVSNV